MRSMIWTVLLIAIIGCSIAEAGAYKMRKKTAEYTVDMMIDRNPPIVAKNTLTLDIKDNGGNPVMDAKVLVNYYMPPMPGMPPMNYNAYAVLSGREYKAVMDLSMSGPWNIAIKITRAGRTVTVRLPIDVR